MLLLTAAPLLATACDSEGRPAPERDRTGDTVTVHNAAPVHADTAILREVARIGAAEGPEELLLDGVSAFVEGPDGRVVVADGSGLRAFSPEGDFLRTIAPSGQGPGEVRYVVGLEVTPDGLLLAADLGNRRIAAYRLDTGGVDHWPLPEGMPGYGRGSIVATRDGPVYVAYNPPLGPGDGPMRYPRPVFMRVEGTGVGPDTLFADERFLEGCPTRSTAYWRGGFYEDVRVRYFPKVKWALSPSGEVAVGCPADYRFDLLRRDGTVLRISRDREPVRVSGAERDAFVEAQTFTRNRTGIFESWSWEGPTPPDRKPAYQRIVFGRRGRIWVWPSRPSTEREVEAEFREMGAPRVVYGVDPRGAWDVFAETGEYMGAVKMPEDVPYRPFPGSDDPFIRGDTLWAVAYDELDVPYLVRYDVQWPERGPAGRDRAAGGPADS